MLGLEMGKPLSMDLRARALAAVDAGMSRRAAARRFDVGTYQQMLDDPSFGEADKAALLEALWSIIVGFVDLGFSVGPFEEGCGQLPDRIEAPHADAPGAADSGLKDQFEKTATRKAAERTGP